MIIIKLSEIYTKYYLINIIIFLRHFLIIFKIYILEIKYLIN